MYESLDPVEFEEEEDEELKGEEKMGEEDETVGLVAAAATASVT